MSSNKPSKIAHHDIGKKPDGTFDLSIVEREAMNALTLFRSGEEIVVGMITNDLGGGKYLRGIITQTK